MQYPLVPWDLQNVCLHLVFFQCRFSLILHLSVDREVFSSPSKYAGHQGNPRNPAILVSSTSTSVGRNQGKTGTSFQSVLSYTDDGIIVFIPLFLRF